MIPLLCHFFAMQPSEAKALTMREVATFADYMEDYRRREAEANRG